MNHKNLGLLLFGILIGATVVLSFQETAQRAPTLEPKEQIVNTLSAVSPSPEKETTARETFRVVRVIDGDTIELEGGERVRLLSIDTPETVKPNTPIQCFGKESSNHARELLEGKEVTLVRDIEDRDKYGRLLRYVYLGNLFVNEALVKDGYARVYTYPPNVTHAKEFVAAERIARSEKRGLWGNICTTTNPPPPAEVGGGEITSGCTIKGNISTSGERIYHILGCPYYTKTQINPSKGERMFCTEEEATAAGWRKAQNCP
jgi:micrococcal nuclease